eukprot:m.265285 g.265285  ORF g.265285 m.265285 type:complete len:67 (+) comp11061_c0_seq1:1087-1287(+)
MRMRMSSPSTGRRTSSSATAFRELDSHQVCECDLFSFTPLLATNSLMQGALCAFGWLFCLFVVFFC